MASPDRIQSFLAGKRFAVVGASRDREKYGNKVLRAYLQNGIEVVPVNPGGGAIEGLASIADLAALPAPVDGVSIVTPPMVTEKVVEEAIRLGIQNIWMQPGAESPRAVELAERAGANVIAGGPCLLVALGYRED
jgi:predicted CoA-binding protein